MADEEMDCSAAVYEPVNRVRRLIDELLDYATNTTASYCLYAVPWEPRTEDTTYQDALSEAATKQQAAAIIRLQRIREEMRDAIEMAKEDGETPITDEARRTCMKIARFVLPRVIQHQDIRTAAFDEGGGQAALIVHAIQKRRRLSLEVSADGSRFVERKTDEHLRTETRRIRSDYVEATIGSIGWLTGEDE